ncbi:MAG TPA: lipopolysaccharide kinase InaA family protein [Pseudomonadales bacterium]|nr:lipopolysaccharide kinase InaA family protein [Pseudomonadales bacterium]
MADAPAKLDPARAGEAPADSLGTTESVVADAPPRATMVPLAIEEPTADAEFTATDTDVATGRGSMETAASAETRDVTVADAAAASEASTSSAMADAFEHDASASAASAAPVEATAADASVANDPAPPQLTGPDLAGLGRDIPVPFAVGLTPPDGAVATLACEALLRVLPGRRIVVRGTYAGRSVVAKLFVGARASIEREWEERGHAAFVRASVATPELVGRGDISGGGEALLYEYLDAAVPATVADLPQAMPILARLHAHGVIQNDLHLNNVLRTPRGLFLVDGGGVSGMGRDKPLSQRASVRNLALFLAQFDIRAESAFVAAWHAYSVARGYKSIDADGGALLGAVHRARAQRVRAYLKKVLRDCTEFHAEKRFDRYLVCDRAAYRGELVKFLDELEMRFDTGAIVKAGNTATVAKHSVDGQSLVVKRYNIKSRRHALGRAWRPSRAQRSWQNAHHLRILGIATFKPIALVERRFGPLRRTAYLVMRDVGGVDLRERFALKHIAPLVALFADLARGGLVHGDAKATNFVDVDGAIHLLDLDAMRMPRTRWGRRRGAARDIARFIANWADSATIRAALLRAFGLAAKKPARAAATKPDAAAAP